MAVGRGDSSLAYLGMAPMPVGRFEVAVRQLSRLLKGRSITMEDAASFGGAPPVASLGYANLPAASRIEWMTEGSAIPLEVVGTGPRLISVGARYADRMSFALGADPDRLRWAVRLAREEAERAGRSPSELSFGCYVQAVCHPDSRYATDIGRGVVATLARFMSLGSQATVPVGDEDRAVIEQIAGRYDMTRHGHLGDQIKVIDDDFAQRFSILGPPSLCRERFDELFEAGVDRIIVMPVNSGSHDDQRASLELLATEVLPHFRRVEAT
jgi:5,10-methylenetetrahydromethanopterin reductase